MTKHLESIRKPFNRAKSGARSAGGGETVAEALREITYSPPFIQGKQFQAGAGGVRDFPDDYFTSSAVLHQVTSHLSDDYRSLPPKCLICTDSLAYFCHAPSREADLAFLTDRDMGAGSHVDAK